MIPSQLLPLANHLWQTTLFAAVVALLTVLLRKNGAHVRYWLWLSASVKFLIPLSTLVDAGGLLGRHAAAAIAPAARVSAAGFSFAIEQVGEPFTTTAAQFTLPAGVRWSYTTMIAPVLIAIWAVGFVFLVCRWAVRWRRMCLSVRSALPLKLPIGLPVKSSPAFGEPGVFGILRPALLLPDGIVDCLTAREMNAIVTHELCHIRRRDNLTTAIHMAVEALFWFHPLVWWVGARLMAEREQACDEEVLRVGDDPRAYAEGILKICEFYLASPLACVSGVTGGNLKRRIEAIVSNRAIPALNCTKKAVLTATAMMAIAAPITIGIVRTSAAEANSQSAAGAAPSVTAPLSKPSHTLPAMHPESNLMIPQVTAQSKAVTASKFEVAAVKPCSAGPASVRGGRGSSGGSPGTLYLDCRTVMSIIQTAYTSGYPPLPPIQGGPSWINSEHYVIEAKAGSAASAATMKGPMLQALLRDRFQLRTHIETKEVSGYALVVAKGGPKLTKHQEGSCVDIGLVVPLQGARPSGGPGQTYCGANHSRKGNGPNVTLDVPGVSLDYFAKTFLGIAFWGHPVINRTGIAGLFDVHLEFSPDDNTPGPPDMVRPPTNPDGGAPSADSVRTFPSIFDAVQQQLGLKLEPAKAPRELLVIDHIEMPSGN